MHHYTQGQPTRQGHKNIPEGHYEEEQGLGGFFGPVSHLIRKKPSTRWRNISGPLKPRLFDLVRLENQEGQQRLLYNNQMTLSMKWKGLANLKPLIADRNADGDTIYFCHQGGGEVFTEYGHLSYRKGHYIVVPKCITHVILPSEDSTFFVIENKNSHYKEPNRGMVGRHAVYDLNTIGKPCLETLNSRISERGMEVLNIRVKHNDTFTDFKYAECIFDVIGWKGDLFPFTLHVDHIMPLMSHRAHLPPSAHTTFVARDFVICTFLPRPLESDDDALKVPFYHQNIDYDEVLFYHDGNFFSRDNLHAGMMSFHPAGFPHGPHPKAVKGIKGKTHTDEYAVMVDVRWPLKRDPVVESVELADYWKSWQSK